MSEHDPLDAYADADYTQASARFPRQTTPSEARFWHNLGYRHGYREAIRHGNAIGDVVGALHRGIPIMERFASALEEDR